MSQLILSLLLAVQGGPAHAELHPADADLYLSVPDVQAIVDAYGNAPLLQTMHDAGLHEFIAGLGADLKDDPRALLADWIDRLMPGAGSMLDEMQAFSISFAQDAGAEKPFGIEFVASFSSAEHALAAQAFAVQSGGQIDAPEGGAQEVPGLSGIQRFTSAAMEGMELWCVTVGERFVLGGGSTTVEGLGARLAGTDAGLKGSVLLEQAAKSFGAGSGTTVCWLAQRRSPLALLSEADAGGAMFSYDSLPTFLDPLAGRRALRMQLRGHRFVTEMFSPGEGEYGALGREPLQVEWLRRVPADAMFVYSTSLDGKGLTPKAREVFTFLGEADVPDLAGVLAGLGPGMVTYMFPVSGLGAPQTHAWVDVDDAPAFTARMTALCTKLAETQPGITSRTRDYKVKDKATGERRPFPVTTITLPPELLDLGAMFPTSPAFAEVEGGILFGLSSMHVKRELKRIYGGEEAPVDPIAIRGFEVPAGSRSVVFMDWGMQIESALTLLRALGGMAGDTFPFDLNTLPDPEAFTKYLHPTFHLSRAVEGGTYRYHEASFGPETWIAITSAMFLGLDTFAPEAPPMLPPVDESEPAGDGG